MTCKTGAKPETISACLMALFLAACGAGERDTIADRIEPEISAEHAMNPGERRQVAESLADDVLALRDDARQLAAAEPDPAREAQSQDGAVEDLMARDCAMMRLELEALQRPSREIRTAEEIAAIPKSIEELKLRLQQNCQGR